MISNPTHWLYKGEKFLRWIVIPVLSICALSSLFLPYIMRSNIHSGPLVAATEQGIHMITPYITLFSTLLGIIAIYSSRRYPAIIVGVVFILFACMSLLLIRYSIHFQGSIDHDFDTKSGSGFYLLVLCMGLFLITTLILLISAIKFPEIRKTPGDLLDQ